MLFPKITGKNRSLLCTVFVSVIVIAVSLIVALVAIPLIIDAVIKSYLQVQEGTEAWDRFVELPFPLDFKIYFFNVTNPVEAKNGAKPHVVEVGPYIYKNYRIKYDIKHEDNGYVSFYQNQTFFFDQVATGDELSLNDRITNLNMLMVGVTQFMENSQARFPFLIQDVLPYVLDDTDIFATFDVGKFLFDGIEFCDPKRINAPGKLVCLIVMLLDMKMVEYRDDLSMKYSLFSFKNNTHDGRFTVNTGVNNIADIGKISKWNNDDRMKVWSGDECDKVEGLDQTLYPPYFEKGSSFKIFNMDICRAISLEYEKEEVYKDIDIYRFGLPSNTFFIEDDSEKSCYCSNFTRDLDGNFSCFLDGVQDIFPCLGIPGFVSFPHFLHADKKYEDTVDGLTPSSKEHSSYMKIQPLVGVPLEGYIGIQISLIGRPTYIDGEILPITENLRPFAIPAIWLQQGVEINDDYYSLLSEVVLILYWIEIGKWIVIGLISLIFVVRLVCLTRSIMRGENSMSVEPEPRISVTSKMSTHA